MFPLIQASCTEKNCHKLPWIDQSITHPKHEITMKWLYPLKPYLWKKNDFKAEISAFEVEITYINWLICIN